MTKNRVGGALILIFCVWYAWLIGDITLLPFQQGDAFTARTMPIALSALGIVLAILTIVLPHQKGRLGFGGLDWRRGLAFLVLMSVYGISIRPAGFLIATTGFLMVGFAMLGERRVWMQGAVAIPLVFGFWFLMTEGLDVYIDPLPAAF